MEEIKIIVFSDSHGSAYNLRPTMEMHRGADVFAHLGDGVAEFLRLKNDFPETMFVAVRGNCDIGADLPKIEETMSIGGKRIILTHGHRYGVKFDTYSLFNLAREREADIVLYGHTHEKKIEYRDGIYVACPGSTTIPRDTEPSYMVITLKNGDILIS